jgi:adenosylhomocysteine nucleosidase
MRLGIVVAMPAEARSLTKQRLVLGGQIEIQEGISLHVSGIGPRRARRSAEGLLGKGCTALLSWGTAGGLVPGLSPGSLLLPKRVIAADQTVRDVDLSWHGRIIDRLSGRLRVQTEPLAESPGALTTPAEKKHLSHRTEAVAVDMESAALAAVAQRAAIPFLAIRAISDDVALKIPRSFLTAMDERGRLRLIILLKGLARRPIDLFALIRLGRGFHAAQAALTTVAHLLGKNGLIP